MHFDWQLIAVAAIVLAAGWHVGRILAAQIAGFRSTAKPGSSGCGGCGEKSTKPAPLITLSTAPPRRVVLPKDTGTESKP